jgi:hypothetical protein
MHNVLTTFSYHVINRCTFRVERPYCLLYKAASVSDYYSVSGRITGELLSEYNLVKVNVKQSRYRTGVAWSGIPWYSFLEAESTPENMVPSVPTEKIGNQSRDHPISSAVP